MENINELNEINEHPARPVFVLWYYLAALLIIAGIFVLALRFTEEKFTAVTLLYFFADTAGFLFTSLILIEFFKRREHKTAKDSIEEKNDSAGSSL